VIAGTAYRTVMLRQLLFRMRRCLVLGGRMLASSTASIIGTERDAQMDVGGEPPISATRGKSYGSNTETVLTVPNCSSPRQCSGRQCQPFLR
jgi:hypothetical protein